MNIYNEATKAKKQESFSNLEGKIKISWYLIPIPIILPIPMGTL